VGVTFFLASAGASSAYLTASEIFPMETRALAIAFFYAVGTAVGGITGPLLFGNLINSGKLTEVATGFFIGAVVMACGGGAELFFGVRAEQRSLESIAEPLSAEDGDPAGGEGAAVSGSAPASRPRLRRDQFRPGPGRTPGWPGMPLPAAPPTPAPDREVEAIVRALREHGATRRSDLGRTVGANQWGPGRFGASLRIAQQKGEARRIDRVRYEAARHDAAEGGRESSPSRQAAGGGSDGSRRSSGPPRTHTGNAGRG
jgi:hypothetical protein